MQCRDGIVDKSDFAIIKESFEVKRAEAEKAIDRLQKEAENIAAGLSRSCANAPSFVMSSSPSVSMSSLPTGKRSWRAVSVR